MALSRLKVVFQRGIEMVILMIILMNCHSEKESLPFYNTANFTAEWINLESPKYQRIHTIKPFNFYDQQGKIYGSDSLKGKIYVANFFFTICPSICPKMTNNLTILQEKFKQEKDFKLISFSVTPWIDSVETLKKYGEKHNINVQQWHLLTGPKEAIYELGRQSFFAEKTLGLSKGTNDFLHTEAMLLIDRNARIRGIYNATNPDEIERITDNINTLLDEK
jgi:protein SCO1